MTVMTDDIDPPDQSDPAEKALALARGAEHEHRVMNSPEGVKLLDAVAMRWLPIGSSLSIRASLPTDSKCWSPSASPSAGR